MSDLSGFRCPRCGDSMERGYIVGHWTRLRWSRKAKTKTIFAGEPLKKRRDWWNAPTVTATRCCRCKIGLFAFD